MPDQKPKEAIDIFLWRCAQKDHNQCIHDMSDVALQLDKLSKHHKKHISSFFLTGIMVMMILVSRYCMLCYEDKKQQIYNDLIRQKAFEKAICANPDQIDAYRAYLSYTNKKDALKHIERLCEQEAFDLHPDIKQYLVLESMTLKDLSTAHFAYQLLQRSKSEFDQSYRQILGDVLDKKDCKRSLSALYTQIIKETDTDSSVHKELLADLYELSNDLDKTMWMQLIQLYEEASMQDEMHRVQYAFVVWQIERKDKDVTGYIQKLEKEWQSDKDLLLLSSLYMDAFESCISDEEKHAHLHMLQEAKTLLKKIKHEDVIRESIQQTISQLDYLMEKWRIYE